MNPTKISTLVATGMLAFTGMARAAEIGVINLDTRLRFETAEIEGLEDAETLSLRLRLGYTTPDYQGFTVKVEGEFTGVADEDDFHAAGVSGDPAKAVIADPESTQLDQLFVAYKGFDTEFKLGRQVITLDNHRFVGDVGWRQNRQTFDAFTVKNNSVEHLTLFYGYVDNVVRIFGSEAPATGGNASEADSESHLFNGSYKVSDQLKATAYGYLLDLKDIPAGLSSETFGLSAQGTVKLEDASVGYYAEYARQSDYGDNPMSYDADYVHLAVNGGLEGFTGTVGVERLGSDDTGATDEDGKAVLASFKTPLATLHKFEGFADRFLATPANGIEDTYVTIGYKFQLPEWGPLVLQAWYHDFSSDKGSQDLGDEFDVVIAKPLKFDSIPGAFKLLGKYASYRKGDVGADTDRAIVELNYLATF